MKTLEFKNTKKEVVIRNLTDFLLRNEHKNSEAVIVNINTFFNDVDEHWYTLVSYYDN